MKTCAFLTTSDLTGFVTDDHLAVPHLEQRGWRVEHVPWRADTDWDRYDIAVVRSTWDYQSDPAAFDAALQRIEDSSALLCNPLDLMRWNLQKTYLRDLEARGVPTLHTHWGRTPSVVTLRALFAELASAEIVVKPVIGANAGDAFRLHESASDDELAHVARVFDERDFLAQRFLRDVVTEGEYSLIYIAGELSHTILKTPKRDDFRVQEEHGGLITSVTPSPGLLRCGAAAMRALRDAPPAAAALREVPLYARADFVRVGADDFAVMELELIEPALYFRMHGPSAVLFADAVERAYVSRASAAAAASASGASAGALP